MPLYYYHASSIFFPKMTFTASNAEFGQKWSGWGDSTGERSDEEPEQSEGNSNQEVSNLIF